MATSRVSVDTREPLWTLPQTGLRHRRGDCRGLAAMKTASKSSSNDTKLYCLQEDQCKVKWAIPSAGAAAGGPCRDQEWSIKNVPDIGMAAMDRVEIEGQDTPPTTAPPALDDRRRHAVPCSG